MMTKENIKPRLISFFLVICLGFGLFVGVRFGSIFKNCNDLREVIVSREWLAPVVYVFFSTLLIMLFVPRTLIMILGGICFGARWGTLWVLLASMISSFFSFWIARTNGRSWIERTFKKREWFFKLENLTQKSGFHLVLISRLTHVIHFGATSYACGVLNLKWSSFFWGTFLGILPGTVVAVYSAQILGCGLWEGTSSLSSESVYHIITASLLVVLLSLIPLWINRKKTKKT